jgi:hypothetical protein
MIIKHLSVADINNGINNLITLKSNIYEANADMVKNVIDTGEKIANTYNDAAPHSSANGSEIQSQKDTDDTDPYAFGYIALAGDSAVYDEFGTGDMGMNDPHPMKNVFDLNPYNSGPTIVAVNSNYHYWVYPPGGSWGNPYYRIDGYTRGIPSGKQMYNTANDLTRIIPKVAKEEFQGAIRNYK